MGALGGIGSAIGSGISDLGSLAANAIGGGGGNGGSSFDPSSFLGNLTDPANFLSDPLSTMYGNISPSGQMTPPSDIGGQLTAQQGQQGQQQGQTTDGDQQKQNQQNGGGGGGDSILSQIVNALAPGSARAEGLGNFPQAQTQPGTEQQLNQQGLTVGAGGGIQPLPTLTTAGLPAEQPQFPQYDQPQQQQPQPQQQGQQPYFGTGGDPYGGPGEPTGEPTAPAGAGGETGATGTPGKPGAAGGDQGGGTTATPAPATTGTTPTPQGARPIQSPLEQIVGMFIRSLLGGRGGFPGQGGFMPQNFMRDFQRYANMAGGPGAYGQPGGQVPSWAKPVPPGMSQADAMNAARQAWAQHQQPAAPQEQTQPAATESPAAGTQRVAAGESQPAAAPPEPGAPPMPRPRPGGPPPVALPPRRPEGAQTASLPPTATGAGAAPGAAPGPGQTAPGAARLQGVRPVGNLASRQNPPTGRPMQPSVDRRSFQSQITPETTERMAWMVNGEVGKGAPARAKIVQLESAFNRAQMRGQSLNHVLMSHDFHGGYYAGRAAPGGGTYGPKNRPTPAEVEDFKRNVLGPVMAGSNESDVGWGPMTGNASGGVAARQQQRGYKLAGGDQYFLEGPVRRLPTMPGAAPTQVAQTTGQAGARGAQGQQGQQGAAGDARVPANAAEAREMYQRETGKTWRTRTPPQEFFNWLQQKQGGPPGAPAGPQIRTEGAAGPPAAGSDLDPETRRLLEGAGVQF